MIDADWFCLDWLNLDPVFWSCLFGFFWANCPCCKGNTCGDWCPDGAPEQLQATIPEFFTDVGIVGLDCPSGNCDTLTGVMLFDLVPDEEVADKAVGDPTGLCVYTSPDFYMELTCEDQDTHVDVDVYRYTFRYVLQGNALAWDMWLVRMNVGSDVYEADRNRWQIEITDEECGDPLDLAFIELSSLPTSIVPACDLDTGQTILVELPP